VLALPFSPGCPRLRVLCRRVESMHIGRIRSWLVRMLSIAVVLLIVVAPRRSTGAEHAVAYRAALLEALAAKDRALDSGKAEDWTRALELLRRADAVQSAAVTKYEIAFAAAQLDQVDVALEHYQKAIAAGLPERASDRAQEYIRSNLARVARLQIDGPSGTVINLNGERRGQLPLPTFMYVMPGAISIEAVFPNATRRERDLTLAAGRLSHIVIEPVEAEEVIVDAGATTQDKDAVARSRNVEQVEGRRSADSLIRKSSATHASKAGGSSLRRVGWTLAATGATLAAVSAAFIPIASSKVSSSRDALRNACDVQLNGPDTCAHSQQGRWEEAQSASNSIATWKMARAVSWVGLVTGVAMTLGGSAVILRSRPAGEHPRRAWSFSVNTGQMQVSYGTELW
jgi:hypothetical protein